MKDPGRVMQEHYDLQKPKFVGNPPRLVKCATCSKRKSIAQYKNGSADCMQCVLRQPKEAA